MKTGVRQRQEAGALLIELIVAVMILATVSVGVSMALGGASKLEVANQARNRLSAASEAIDEKLRSDTKWMGTNQCKDTLAGGPGATCSLNYMFDGSGSGDYATVMPGLTHPEYGTIGVDVTASAVDSADDGVGALDKDKLLVDSYKVRIEAQYEGAEDLGLKNDTPVVLETVINTSAAANRGSLVLQVCQVREQADERLAIRECDQSRQIRLEPGARFDPRGFSVQDQAFSCAHPDYYRGLSGLSWVDAAGTGAASLPTNCFSASDSFGVYTTSPAYRPAFNLLGYMFHSRFPSFEPKSSNLPPDDAITAWDDRYKYVSTIVGPVTSLAVSIEGIAGTPTAGEAFSGNTDSQGYVRWNDLKPGRYLVKAPALVAGAVLSDQMSVPGTSVTVTSGNQSKATQVYLPPANKSVRIALETVDISYPWHPHIEGWRVLGGYGLEDFAPPFQVSHWNTALGNQWGGTGAPYTAQNGSPFTWSGAPNVGPGPWADFPRHSTWKVNNGSDGSPQPLCLVVRAIPYGRLVNNGGNQQCHYNFLHNGGTNTEYYTFPNLAPGLYTYEVQGVPAFVWMRENSPGFIWVDEDGTTYPSSTGAWTNYARATYYGCRDDWRAAAAFVLDMNLKHGGCGAPTDSSTGNEGGSGGG